jgi:UDP-N-acetylglucosamine 2-epimerase (non-hydrolysing)
MIVDIIAGARPNFIKIAPLIEAFKKVDKDELFVKIRLIHTGQHFDNNMSSSFFEQLGIPKPDFNLGAGGGTQAEQTATIMIGYEGVIKQVSPDICIVVGDVTSTMACTIVARKMQIPVAHVEAGIRSGDCSMPEEINRLVTDSITNYFFTTTPEATSNLRKSGVSKDKIFWVGNIMIDTLLKYRPFFKSPKFWEEFGLIKKGYFIVTLHRPANVDDSIVLEQYLTEIVSNVRGLPVIFPVHPRTSVALRKLDLSFENLILIEPLPYFEFNFLVDNSLMVITDSGGITEETTVLGIPCITLRDNSERMETVRIGTNELIGTNPVLIKPALNKLFNGSWKKGSVPRKWDGKTGVRIVEIISNILKSLE